MILREDQNLAGEDTGVDGDRLAVFGGAAACT